MDGASTFHVIWTWEVSSVLLRDWTWMCELCLQLDPRISFDVLDRVYVEVQVVFAVHYSKLDNKLSSTGNY